MNPLIGHHMSREQYGLVNAVKVLIQMGGNATQICLSAPQTTLKGKAVTDIEAAEVKQLCKENGIYIVVHGKYTYNFCRRFVTWQLNLLEHELIEAAKLNADLVIHQGNNMLKIGLSREEALKNYACQIQSIILQTPGSNRILLENSCQQGAELGYTLEELAKIYKLFSKEAQKRIGFCIDTCHIFVAGELDMEPHSIRPFFERFDNLIGLNNLRLVHLNDSKIKFGCKRDRHEALFKGVMPRKGLSLFIEECAVRGIPMVLETPTDDVESEIGVVWDIIENM